MESNNYEWFMTSTVESMLPRFTDKNIVLTMKISADWNDFGYDESGDKQVREPLQFRKEFFLVFHRPSNYTKVLMLELPTNREDDNWDFNRLPCGGSYQMKQLSDHDSCWKSDGMRWVFQSFCDAWNFFEEKGLEGRKIDPSFHYSLFSGAPQYWLIGDIEPEISWDHWCSDYIVNFVKKIPVREISKYMSNTE